MTRQASTLGLCCAIALVFALGPVASAESPATTTVILVRHAEKAADGQDPPLSAAGQERAQVLVRVLGDVPVAAVFASQFRRTRETVAPLASRHGLEVTVAAVEHPTGSSRALAERILSEHPGRIVLVAGHSNTVPQIIDALGAGPPPEIGHDDYDDLFVVTVGPGSARSLRLSYGAPSP